MQATRQQIVEIIKRRGQATVEELARALGITLMAVRLHLVVLERDNLVVRSSLRMGPGRPTLLYRLTPAAEEVFPKAYDLLASELLSAARRDGGSRGVETLCREAARGLADRMLYRLEGQEVAQRLDKHLQVMSSQGYPMECEGAENGYFLHTYSCPFYRVAQAHREVCVLHVEMLRMLLGTEVETVTCQLDGDLRCSHLVRVPASDEVATRPEQETTPVDAI